MENLILKRDFYSRHPSVVAKEILGKLLVRRLSNKLMVGMVTETEAYGPPFEDPLVKTKGVKGLRMDWEPGLAWTTYIMRGRPTLNITTITPSCILIRAVEPIEGFILSRERTTVGPVNLAKAMKIDESLDKLDVCTYGPLFVCDFKLTSPIIVESKRKNVRIDTEECRRFFIKGNKFVS